VKGVIGAARWRRLWNPESEPDRIKFPFSMWALLADRFDPSCGAFGLLPQTIDNVYTYIVRSGQGTLASAVQK
jgi:hypothetical protein